MAAERDFEMLDDYLANRLGEQEKSAFEQKLNTDPELKSEYELQQQLISGIKKARVAELKAMMGKIPVPAGSSTGTAIGAKIALWAAVVGVVGTGLYFYIDNNQTSETPADSTVQQAEEAQRTEQTQPEVTKPDESPEVSEGTSSAEQKPAESPKAAKKEDTEVEISREPKIEVFDPTTESDENDSESIKEDIDNNTLKENQNSSIAVEIDSQNKKYNFHYRFKDGRLMLYGPFEKNLYEIMEFFSDNRRTVFLFYNNDYYLLKEDNDKLKPLNPIEDTALIKKLKDYRK